MQNYEILSRDTVVARWENEALTVLHEALLPLYLRYSPSADNWLETRAIDAHRANSRLLKKALRLQEKDDLSTVLHVNGATITDTYWIRPIGSNLAYNDVRFRSDYFSRLALKGTFDSFNRVANSKHSRTPELTNIGSFEKCWKLRNGKWWMYKKATPAETFSELFVYHLGTLLGMHMAKYERGEGCIKTLDFTDGASVNFEPASTFMHDNDDYVAVLDKLSTICPRAIPDYIQMIFMDTIAANPDRHTNNFGLLRSVESGELSGLAPLFDHNMALISRGYPQMPKKSDLLITLMRDLLQVHPEYRQYIPALTEETVRTAIAATHMRVKSKFITEYVMKRYALLMK